MPTLFDERSEGEIADELRRAVAAAEFDYPALVRGVRRRVARLRRRRMIVTGAGVAVLAPTLVGGAALVLPGLLPSGIPTAATPPAAMDQAVSADQAVPVAWEIPDARPTGVDVLDDLGTPRLGLDPGRIVPVSGVMACDGAGARGGSAVEPLTGRLWSYSVGGVEDPAVDIQVTGWADSTRARDALRDERMTSCSRDTDTAWERLRWEGHRGDDDYLLYRTAARGLDYGIAVVRQGDYLVGVTVTGVPVADLTDVAAEIAGRAAANLEALDPVHGRD